MEIFILGIGNIGKFIAHSLARKPNPPTITLLFHRPELARMFKQVGQSSIEIITGGFSDKQSSFRSESITTNDSNNNNNNNNNNNSEPSARFIRNIIVATKANHTISGLESVKSRLDCRSTVLFTQNGMGRLFFQVFVFFPPGRIK